MAAQMVQWDAVIHLNGEPSEVFPLFTALGERRWVQGWNPELVYPASGEAMTNNVFITRNGDAATVWVTVDYDPQGLHVEYVNFTPESHVQRVNVQCRPADNGTEARVSYTRIATHERGYEAVAHLTEPFYAEMMEHWQQAINYTLAHDALMPAHRASSE